MSLHYEVVVVGGGLSGLAAATVLARNGVEVLVIERGDYPGAKNLMGGVLYRRPTEEVFPGFEAEAPLERKVTRQELWFLTDDSAATFGYGGRPWEEDVNAYTVLRAPFDQWLGLKAAEAGAEVLTETTVTELVVEHDRVVGVRTSRPDGDIEAGLVIVAQGANRILTENAGLAPRLDPRDMSVAAKEVISLPAERIEERFRLRGKQGMTVELLGAATRGLTGIGFLYTNRESVSIGLGVLIHQMVEAKLNPSELLDGLKSHPAVRQLIEGGETREYSAHMIPEGGYDSVPPVYGDGLLVVGDAAMLTNALHREGSNLAMISGKLAAETAVEARRSGGYTKQNLAAYRRRLEDSFVLKDLKQLRNANQFLDHRPEFFRLYPRLLNEVVREYMTVDMVPKREKRRSIARAVGKSRPPWRIATDLLKGWRTLG